jgi:hypothetical protein
MSNNTAVPATRKDIETAVGVMFDELRSDNPSAAIFRVNGKMTDDQIAGIEQGILLVRNRKVRLTHHYYPEPEEGEDKGGYTVLGIAELNS